MLKFYGAVEFLGGQRAAILTLTDQAGEWAGSGRIEVRSGVRADLYEEAYRQASFNALTKGGRLERFSVAVTVPTCAPVPTFATIRAACGSRVESALPRRPANALNLEIGKPLDRCLGQRPEHWPNGSSSLRWIASGGSPLVFGVCSAATCPERLS